MTMLDCAGAVSDEIKPTIIYNFTYQPTINRSQPAFIGKRESCSIFQSKIKLNYS
jgi:hypothetical protein